MIAGPIRPPVRTLLIALALTVALWFIPYADALTYPLRLFATFIHEGSHALAALLTGNHVLGLRVAPNGGGATYTTSGNLISGMLVASAGYLGTMAYGTLLLALLRRAVAAGTILAGSAAVVLALTVLYGFPSPFTLAAGVLLALGLVAAARYAGPRLAGFLVGFLAVQCVVDALFDLRTLLAISAPFAPGAHSDAAIMAQLTGIPAIFWALLWTALALVMLTAALRAYAGERRVATALRLTEVRSVKREA